MTTFGKKTQCIVVDQKKYIWKVFTQELHLINKHASKPLYSYFLPQKKKITCYDVCVLITNMIHV